MPFISSVRGSFGSQGKTGRTGSGIKTSVTGGTITTAGGYRIHTFTTTGSSTFDTTGFGYPLSVEYLVVAGGGGGGVWVGGAGGAGGMRTGSLTLSTPAAVVVGAGANGWIESTPQGTPSGNGFLPGGPGLSSTFGPIVSTGGGQGGCYGATSTPSTLLNGGSGGGGMENASTPASGGTGVPGQGNNGGSYSVPGSRYLGGGGGGAGQAGAAGVTNPSGPVSAKGGNGLSSSISGAAITYAGGGGGGFNSNSNNPNGYPFTPPGQPPGGQAVPGAEGGLGGGGAGWTYSNTPPQGWSVPLANNRWNPLSNGTNGLGGGGGGSGWGGPGGAHRGGSGGSGVIIVRYLV